MTNNNNLTLAQADESQDQVDEHQVEEKVMEVVQKLTTNIEEQFVEYNQRNGNDADQNGKDDDIAQPPAMAMPPMMAQPPVIAKPPSIA